MNNVPGYVRGFDVRTGKRIWTFHTIPQAGEFGNETWEKGSWKYTGNTAVWAPMSADLELGYVYLPVETPTGDFYGGHRPGNDLFDESMVCLDAKTGKRVWHFQVVHHGIWDWDLPAAPVLVDITVDGRKIKAIAQVTKQAFTWVLDRTNGKPVWPVEERPVPQSDVPGEKTSATQPFPSKPAPFDRQGFTENDLADFTPEIKAEALKMASEFKMGPIYTPPIVFDSNGKKGVLSLPNSTGGANWQGAGADPETGILYVPSVTNPSVLSLTHDAARSDEDFIARTVPVPRPLGVPLVKPPYGRITAIDLNTGDHVWMVPNGEASAAMKNNPALKGVDLSKVGAPDRAPIMITKTLLFAGEGAAGPGFRALNKKTGETVFQMTLPGNETGLPMTYMVEGRQFIVVTVSGRDGAELVRTESPGCTAQSSTAAGNSSCGKLILYETDIDSYFRVGGNLTGSSAARSAAARRSAAGLLRDSWRRRDPVRHPLAGGSGAHAGWQLPDREPVRKWPRRNGGRTGALQSCEEELWQNRDHERAKERLGRSDVSGTDR